MPTNTAGGQTRHYPDHMVHYARKYFTKADAGNTLKLVTLPAGALVLRGGVAVIEAFNAGTNNRANLGVAADADDFATLLALGTIGVIVADEMATATDFYSESERDVSVVVDVTGTAATTGKAIAWVEYLVPEGLVGSS